MSRAVPLLLIAAILGAGGCSRRQAAPQPPAAHLSTANPDANAEPVARFVRAACIDAIADPGAIEQAIQATRWPIEENVGSAGQMVTVRDLEHVRIAYSVIPFEAPGGRFHDCQVELDSAVAPSIDRMRAALAAVIPVPALGQPAGRSAATWRWQPDPLRERQIELTAVPAGQAGTRPGLSIHVGGTEYTAPPRAATPDNEMNELNTAAPAPAAAGDAAAPPPGPAEASEPPPAGPSGRWGNGMAPQ